MQKKIHEARRQAHQMEETRDAQNERFKNMMDFRMK
jgi:hypothetical protein